MGEKQIVNALSAMASNASTDELAQAFHDHREETRDQQRRLEMILECLDERGIEGENEVVSALIRQGEFVIRLNGTGNSRDVGLITAAQQVEHFEIASYEMLLTYADMLQRSEDSALLKESFDEETSADNTLNIIKKQVVNPSMKRY